MASAKAHRKALSRPMFTSEFANVVRSCCTEASSLSPLDRILNDARGPTLGFRILPLSFSSSSKGSGVFLIVLTPLAADVFCIASMSSHERRVVRV